MRWSIRFFALNLEHTVAVESKSIYMHLAQMPMQQSIRFYQRGAYVSNRKAYAFDWKAMRRSILFRIMGIETKSTMQIPMRWRGMHGCLVDAQTMCVWDVGRSRILDSLLPLVRICLRQPSSCPLLIAKFLFLFQVQVKNGRSIGENFSRKSINIVLFDQRKYLPINQLDTPKWQKNSD